MIEVVLATFNGEQWIDKQLTSIASQTLAVDRILARDDGSRDRTIEQLEAFGATLKNRLNVVPTHGDNLGVKGNFDRLLELSTGDYVLLADQDDVWHPEKVQRLMSVMARLEHRYGTNEPLYVYSDTRLVDADGAVIAESGWRAQGFDGRSGRRFGRLLVQNVVAGCTLMINRALVERALPVPQEAVMHDWWLVLVGSALGHGACVEEGLVDYRQHGRNDLGATLWGVAGIWARLRAGGMGVIASAHDNFRRAVRQSACLEERYGTELAKKKAKRLRALLNLTSQSWARRRWAAACHGFRKDGILRTLALYLIL